MASATRNKTRAEKNSERSDMTEPEITEMIEEEGEQEVVNSPSSPLTIDPIWNRLLSLPFFQKASESRREEIYFEERERQERKEERQERERKEEREREERKEEREREERKEERERQERKEDREHELRMRQLAVRESRDSTPSSDILEYSASPRVALPDWTEKTQPEQYFRACEKLFAASKVPKDRWVGQLVSKLPPKAARVYSNMPMENANNYDDLKAEIMNAYHIAPEIYRRNFFTWPKQSGETFKEYAKSLQEQLENWVGTTDLNSVNWKDYLIRYRVESQLSPELALHIADKSPDSLQSCLELADKYTLHRQLINRTATRSVSESSRMREGSNFRASSMTNRVGLCSNPPANTNSMNRPANTACWRDNTFPRGKDGNYKYCTYCERRGHQQRDCFVDPSSPLFKGPRNQTGSTPPPSGQNGRSGNSQSSAFVSDLGQEVSLSDDTINPLYEGYCGSALISGSHPKLKFPVSFLRDTGATISILHEGAIPNSQLELTGERITIRGVTHVGGMYPTAKLRVKCDIYEGPMTVVVVPHKPMPGINLVIGNEVFAPPADLKIACGVATRCQTKKQLAPVEIGVSSPLGDCEDRTLSDDSKDGPSGIDLEGPITEDLFSVGHIFQELPEKIDPVSLQEAQHEDSTLSRLWEVVKKKRRELLDILYRIDTVY